MAEVEKLEKEEFPQVLDCPQCRRPYRIRDCKTKMNTILTEMVLVCPRCKRKLKKMRLKDWYDHYVHEKSPPISEKSAETT